MNSNPAEFACSTDAGITRTELARCGVNLLRGSTAGFISLVFSIAASGSWVNWNNVVPLFAFLLCVTIASHVIERLFQKDLGTRSGLWAAFAYSCGAAAGIIVFAVDRYLGWFGHFTGV